MNLTRLLAAIDSPLHPALRWTPIGSGTPRQHRRTAIGDTACGVAGPVTLAETSDPYCPSCFPRHTTTKG